MSYPCVVLNVMVARHNTNDQYQTLTDAGAKRYETSSEMSIEFEVDGPYKARRPLCEPVWRCMLTSPQKCSAIHEYAREQAFMLHGFVALSASGSQMRCTAHSAVGPAARQHRHRDREPSDSVVTVTSGDDPAGFQGGGQAHQEALRGVQS